MSERRVVSLLVVLFLLGGAVWYGQAPPRSAQAYLDGAEETVAALQSQSRVAAVWIDAVAGGKVTHQAAAVALEDTEIDARSAAARFAAWDPPPSLQATRKDLTATATAVVEALAAVRIAVHHGQWDRLSDVGGQLGPLADQLGRQLTALEAQGR